MKKSKLLLAILFMFLISILAKSESSCFIWQSCDGYSIMCEGACCSATCMGIKCTDKNGNSEEYSCN